MPRVLVYVNVNPDKKHITIYNEKDKSSSLVFMQLLAHNTIMLDTIEDISANKDKSAIKIAEAKAKNSFWVLLWFDGHDAIGPNHSVIQALASQHKITPDRIKTDC